ncbi:unnamed protein product [Ostreobium quekettii]|uniref:Secreted protein n=1 Tax=Ostreobium quekettii TaxID=121088 RepID=A0A8S1J9B8_9CHLO|nr:unnamed protein product [Ostreobium quekettii]
MQMIGSVWAGFLVRQGLASVCLVIAHILRWSEDNSGGAGCAETRMAVGCCSEERWIGALNLGRGQIHFFVCTFCILYSHRCRHPDGQMIFLTPPHPLEFDTVRLAAK